MSQNFPPINQLCFLDANILYYDIVAFKGVSNFCSALIRQISAGRRKAATSPGAIADAVHKVMLGEAVEVHGRPRSGMLAWIKSHPHAIESLTTYKAAARKFLQLPLQILLIDSSLILPATEISTQYGLMTNDAIIIAAMRAHGIKHLVTNDDDFDRVPDITAWKPR